MIRILAALLFPALALAGVTYFLILPAVATIGHLSAVVAGIK